MVKGLSAFKLGQRVPAVRGIPQRPDPRTERGEVVHADVRADVDAVRQQQRRQSGQRHRCEVEIIVDRLAQVPRPDPVVPGIVEPSFARQLIREGGFAHT